MNRYPNGSAKHSLPAQDAVPGWARLLLYLAAIIAPFGALAAGRITGQETVAAVVALFGVIGPAVAVVYQKKQSDQEGAHYRAGYATAVAEHIAPALDAGLPVVGFPQAGVAAESPPPGQTQNAGTEKPTKEQE